MAGYRYFVTLADSPEREVTKAEYITLERACGFHSKFGPDEIATASFSYSGPDRKVIRGRTAVIPTGDTRDLDSPP